MRDLFVVTGGAGFIGSHLAARLLADGARVRVLDDFSTGSWDNLPTTSGDDLEVIRGDIRDLGAVERAASGATAIFHQAAMRSVPRKNWLRCRATAFVRPMSATSSAGRLAPPTGTTMYCFPRTM